MLNINVCGYFLLSRFRYLVLVGGKSSALDQQFKTSTLKRKEENEESESRMSSETLWHKQNKHKLWKYDNSYLKMGFTWTKISKDCCVRFVMRCFQMET
jgi:hypothetical protein